MGKICYDINIANIRWIGTLKGLSCTARRQSGRHLVRISKLKNILK